MRKIKIMENTFCSETAKWLTPSDLLKEKKKSSDQKLAVCTGERKHDNRRFFNHTDKHGCKHRLNQFKLELWHTA